MRAAHEAYNRAFHCGVGGHDGHPLQADEVTPDLSEGYDAKYSWQAFDDRCALAVEWRALLSYAQELRAAVNEALKNCPCKPDENGIPCRNCQLLDDRANEHPNWIFEVLGGR